MSIKEEYIATAAVWVNVIHACISEGGGRTKKVNRI